MFGREFLSCGSLSRLFRLLLCLLCLIGGAWTDGSRFVQPTLAMGLSSERMALENSEEQTSEDRAVDSGPSGSGASPPGDSEPEANSDPEPADGLLLADHRIELGHRASSELSIWYSGGPRPGFSSPEPEPAERV
jgi:hypothetical protein